MGITAENIADQWKITREQQASSRRKPSPCSERDRESHFKNRSSPWDEDAQGHRPVRHGRDFKAIHGGRHGETSRRVQEGRRVTPVTPRGSTTAQRRSCDGESRCGESRPENRWRGSFPTASPASSRRSWHRTGHRRAARAEESGLAVEDMDVIESNEAFAVQALAVSCDLKFDPKKTNPNGARSASVTPSARPARAHGESAVRATAHRWALCIVTMLLVGGQGIAAGVRATCRFLVGRVKPAACMQSPQNSRRFLFVPGV